MLLYYFIEDCESGNLRLRDSDSMMEGRVEICFNNTYVSICGDRWDTLEARVVCRQLGYNSDSKGHLNSCTLIYKSLHFLITQM